MTTASGMPVGPAGQAMRRWVRFTPAERIGRSVFYLAAMIAVVWSVKTIEVIPEFLYDAPEQTVDLFRRMWPFDWPYWNKMVAEALVETFHTATLGTIIALLLSVPVALMAARNVTQSTALNLVAKFILVSSRSVNSLIWALLFVAIFGPGALAGVMSIAVRSIGFVGKLFGEALEELWSNAYCVVQPSTMEGLSIALLEALSYGRCVLVSDIPENMEVAEECALSFKSKDVGDLRDKLQHLIEHPEEVARYGAQARAHIAQHYSWDNVAESTARLYEELAGKQRARR